MNWEIIHLGRVPAGLIVVLGIQFLVAIIVLAFVLKYFRLLFFGSQGKVKSGALLNDIGHIRKMGCVAFLTVLGWQLYELGFLGYQAIELSAESCDVRMLLALIKSVLFSFRVVFLSYIVLCMSLLLSYGLKKRYSNFQLSPSSTGQ